MSPPNFAKSKGDRAERDVAAYLREHGFPFAERRFGAGTAHDRGDIQGLVGIVVEVKSCREFRLGPWMDETEREQHNAHADQGVLIVRRPGKPIAQAYVVQTLEQWARVTGDADSGVQS